MPRLNNNIQQSFSLPICQFCQQQFKVANKPRFKRKNRSRILKCGDVEEVQSGRGEKWYQYLTELPRPPDKTEDFHLYNYQTILEDLAEQYRLGWDGERECWKGYRIEGEDPQYFRVEIWPPPIVQTPQITDIEEYIEDLHYKGIKHGDHMLLMKNSSAVVIGLFSEGQQVATRHESIHLMRSKMQTLERKEILHESQQLPKGQKYPQKEIVKFNRLVVKHLNNWTEFLQGCDRWFFCGKKRELHNLYKIKQPALNICAQDDRWCKLPGLFSGNPQEKKLKPIYDSLKSGCVEYFHKDLGVRVWGEILKRRNFAYNLLFMNLLSRWLS
eukprot:TRINITY_DN12013_c1_g1_i3.p1 TRINITY_DN12013_c1_g1~~TRINITY_DN12013_c1_g1_i3.p1  ORF type:complete len:328 (+),score=18.23 TRINITY_DN12013_c1_g1_i3:86-1069(+)